MSNGVSSPDKWRIFILVAVGIFMSTLDGSIVNIALPVIMRDLNTSMAAVEWVMLIYLLTVTTLLLAFGRLGDIKGRRQVYTGGLLLFATGSLCCGFAQHIIGLISARLFQGIGAAMIMACTPAIVVDTFDASERGRALGMVGAVVAFGLTVGPALGGFLTHHFSWRYIFYINIPIGLTAALMVHRLLKGTSADAPRPEQFDHLGALYLIVSLGAFLVALTHGVDWGYASARVITLLAIALAALGVLFRHENRISHPLLEPSLLKIRLFTLPLISAVLLFAGLFTIVFLVPFYLMNPAGFSENQAGYMMMTLFAALFVVSPVSGTLSDRMGSRLLCTVGMGILMVAMWFLAQLPADAPPLRIIWPLVIAGFGIATFLSPNSATTMSAVPPSHRGIAAGMVATSRNLGMVLGVALAGAIFNSTFFQLSGTHFKAYGPDIQPYFMKAFNRGITTGAVLAALGMVTAFLRGPDNPRVR